MCRKFCSFQQTGALQGSQGHYRADRGIAGQPEWGGGGVEVVVKGWPVKKGVQCCEASVSGFYPVPVIVMWSKNLNLIFLTYIRVDTGISFTNNQKKNKNIYFCTAQWTTTTDSKTPQNDGSSLKV